MVPTETGRLTLIQHWDGISCSIIPSPDPSWLGLDLATLENVTAVASDDLWAVGYAEDFASLKSTTLNDEQTLVMNTPSLTSGGVIGDTNVAFATISWIGPVNGSTTTNSFGEYQAAGLPAGEYTFIAAAGGCSPDVAPVTILAGQTITRDFIIDC